MQSNDLSREFSRILNQVTGYEECEKLRELVRASDDHFQQVKERLRRSRSDFDSAIQSRSQCQKELNALLQRKQAWLDEDLMRFTELYRKEMRLEQAEAEAKAANEQLEKEVDKAHGVLMNALRERYQEEQLWSDKIRRVSTFGTFSLMAVNVLLFLIIQLYVEPSKRKRYIANFKDVMTSRLDAMQTDLERALSLYSSSAPRSGPAGVVEPPRDKGELGRVAKGALAGAATVLALEYLRHLNT